MTLVRQSVIVILVFLASTANAGGILDYIRNYDLNDYALGVSYSVSQRPYIGAENSSFAYPYLTSFRHNAFTDLTVFHDRYYLTFRSCPDGHPVHPTSSIIVLGSSDARTWA